MKKKIKIFMVLILFLLLIASYSFAGYSPETFNAKITTTGTENITTLGGKIVGIIQIVGTVAAVGTLMIIGIKYMMGSAEEKAEYKKTLFPYLIGAVLLFAAVNITTMVFKWAGAL